MRETIIKGWDKTCSTRVVLLTFQLAVMEVNITTPLFEQPTNVEVVEEVDIDIDPTMPMSTIVENYLQSTPPTTCVGPSGTRQKIRAQAKKKKTLIPRRMKSIGMFLLACATIDIDPKKTCATDVVGPKLELVQLLLLVQKKFIQLLLLV